MQTHPSSSISGRWFPPESLPIPTYPLIGTLPPFSQYETGDGHASTWHSSATSEPNGAPSSCDGALTVGWTMKACGVNYHHSNGFNYHRLTMDV